MILVRLFIQTVLLALGQIWANKTRAMLTALGIIIGVASVIAVVAGLSGMRGFVLKEFETFGARKVWVWGELPDELRTTMSWSDVKMTTYEIRQLVEKSPSIEKATPQMRDNLDIAYGTKLLRGVSSMGIWPEWHEIEGRSVIFGREMSQADNDNALQVCLINEKAVEELNLPNDPSGEILLVKGRRFVVIGVLETKQQSAMFGGGTPQAEIFIPYETQRMLNPYRWMWMMGQLKNPELAEDAKAEVRFIMRTMRGLSPGEPDTFEMEVLQNAIDQFNGLASGITLVAFAVMMICLLVGGIGIMNIMLASVSERTREIGLRKAVGARPAVVLMQFLVEAITLCVVGGLIGVAIGQGVTLLMKSAEGSALAEASVPAWAIGVAFGFSAAVGVVFGMFPAMKAARLNPIDALRHE